MSGNTPASEAVNLLSCNASNVSNISNCSSNSSNCSSSSHRSSCNTSSNEYAADATMKKAAAAPSTGSSNLWQFFCLVIACVTCYYNSLQCGLVFDDISAIRDNKDLRGNTSLLNIFQNDFWGTPIRKEQSHKSYRPLTVLTFRINYWLHELAPMGYHLTNLLLHIVVCLLYKRVCRLLLKNCAGAQLNASQLQQSSFLAALLFAVHPIHTEAVTGVVGRAELLSSCFYLLAFLIYARAVQIKSQKLFIPSRGTARQVTKRSDNRTDWLLLSTAFTACLLIALLCKEQGITIAGICLAYEIFVVQQLNPLDLWHLLQQMFEEQRQQRSVNGSPEVKAKCKRVRIKTHLIKRLLFLLLLTVSLLVGRVYIMGSQLPVFTRFDNPAAAAETPARQLTYSYLIYLNVWLMLFPRDLCCDWTMGKYMKY